VLDGVKTFQLGWSDCTDSPIQEAFITLVNKECELYVPEVVLDRSITRLKEKKTKELLRKRKLSEEQEKFKNLLEYSVKAKLDSFLVTTIQEEDYQNFLPIAINIIPDADDDAHTLATAIKVKSLYPSKTVIIWSHDKIFLKKAEEIKQKFKIEVRKAIQ